MNYTARIYKDGDAYSVEFPDLDGCFTQGDTLEEALTNAKEAMELTLEDVFDGCPLPECKTKANEEKGFYRIDVDPELAARFLKSTTPWPNAPVFIPYRKAHRLLSDKEKCIFVYGVIMSYDVLEKEIRQLPESYLEDVSKYIQFLLYQYEQERMSALEESDEVFNAKMQKGLDDVRNGRVTPLDDAFAELKQRFA